MTPERDQQDEAAALAFADWLESQGYHRDPAMICDSDRMWAAFIGGMRAAQPEAAPGIEAALRGLARHWEREYVTDGGWPAQCAREMIAVLDRAAQQPGAVTEHATRMSGGGYHARWDDPMAEKIYPLGQWIKDARRNGGKVLRRRVIVVEDWAEVEA